ncbi:24942_t:CDS:2 [Gigaspora margarita]|uniref:24942_t:CDS:1 n=1 Tax=Gigaspora margarita TaxID=4874 RepID=A0ABN7USC2_GIGMA|nr:24942_t:CDS:2 [Gigaspora margarita]
MPAVTKNITFDFGAVCLVSGQISKPMFWFPLACFVIPAFLIHIMTFIHISKAQWTLARDFEDSSLGTIVTSSSATMDNITSLTDPWISEWITCLMNHKLTNDGQSKCAHISLKHVPDAIFLTIAELLTASLGISIFLVFGTSVGLLREWRYWFIKTFGHVEKYDNSRFM